MNSQKFSTSFHHLPPTIFFLRLFFAIVQNSPNQKLVDLKKDPSFRFKEHVPRVGRVLQCNYRGRDESAGPFAVRWQKIEAMRVNHKALPLTRMVIVCAIALLLLCITTFIISATPALYFPNTFIVAVKTLMFLESLLISFVVLTLSPFFVDRRRRKRREEELKRKKNSGIGLSEISIAQPAAVATPPKQNVKS